MKQKNNPKISIIMAVYNSEKYLDEAIESILNQTLKDFEFIIINDASTDNSLKIIKKYIKKDKRIILINNNKNIGRAKARNKALKIAKGKYIAILDSDDIALLERLKKQFSFLEKNKNIFLVGSRAIKIEENGKIRGVSKSICNNKKLMKRLIKKNAIYHPSVMYRNSGEYFYRGKFPYAQDYDLYLQILSDNKILTNLKEPLIKYRINPNAISWSKNGKQELFAKKANEFYHQRVRYGKDEYNKFNPNEILDINIEKSIDKTILKQEIFASFKLNDFKKTRKHCKKYFKHYGYFNKALIYFLLSFRGNKNNTTFFLF